MNKFNLASVFVAISVAVSLVQSTHGAAIGGADILINRDDIAMLNCLCTLDYSPICGSDSRTYPNKCFLQCVAESPEGKRRNLKMKSEGPCADEAKSEECFCTREYLPLCGSNDVTYSNKCDFECAAKSPEGKQNNLKVKYEGECTETDNTIDDVEPVTDCICTLELLPVCGTDGVTYPNKCQFKCAQRSAEGKKEQLELKFEGACEEAEDDDCLCTREYLPVCGNDDITYSNKCEFNCARNKKKNLKVKFFGQCDE